MRTSRINGKISSCRLCALSPLTKTEVHLFHSLGWPLKEAQGLALLQCRVFKAQKRGDQVRVETLSSIFAGGNMPYKSLAAQETLDTAAELEIECLDNLQGDACR